MPGSEKEVREKLERAEELLFRALGCTSTCNICQSTYKAIEAYLYGDKPKKLSDIDYDDLNPGIRDTVRVLRIEGFDTCDSGDGQTRKYDCDLELPYVHIKVDPSKNLVAEADRLMHLVKDHGLEVAPVDNDKNPKAINIQATYDPADRLSILTVFNLKL